MAALCKGTESTLPAGLDEVGLEADAGAQYREQPSSYMARHVSCGIMKVCGKRLRCLLSRIDVLFFQREAKTSRIFF